MAVNLVLVSILVFLWLGILPGDFVAAFLGQDATAERVEQFKELHGLNGSIPERYLNWAEGVLRGDFGNSLRSSTPVVDEFMRRLPITLEIVLISFAVTTSMGIIGGIISATRQNSGADYGMRVLAVAGLSIPNFLLLTLLLVIPSRTWSYAPPFGSTKFFDDPVSNLELFLPATIVLAISSSAGLMRLTRSAFLEVMRQDYMRTARAKGLAERVVTFRHGFRNALPPVLTLVGLQLGNLLGGSVILENVMGLPGLGNWFIFALNFNDYPIVMIVSLYSAAVLMTITLVIDLTYAWLDPRIRYG
jgi:peptide/nickel transport system permease protein